MKHDLTNVSRVVRRSSGEYASYKDNPMFEVCVQLEASNRRLAILERKVEQNDSKAPAKEHHYHSNTGVFGKLLMVLGCATVVLVAYSAFKMQPISKTVEIAEYNVHTKAVDLKDAATDTVTPEIVKDAGSVIDKVASFVGLDGDTLSMTDHRGKSLVVGDKVISKYKKHEMVLSIREYGGELVMDLTNNFPEDSRQRVFLKQEDINRLVWIKAEHSK